MKKKSIVFFLLLTITKSAAAQVRSELNTLINDYTLPTFMFTMLIGVIVGFVKNWKLISDSNDQGTRKEGFINIGYIAGYAFVVASILSIIMTKISSISITI